MTLSDPFFLFFAAVTVVGALLAVTLRNVFYNALALVLCLFGVAALFIFLQAEFLAVMEVIIYIGAIAVAIIFTIMLTRDLSGKDLPASITKRLGALIGALLVLAVVLRAVWATRWPVRATAGDYSIQALGRALSTTYILPFEVISVVLLVAIIGALVLCAKEEPR